MQFGLGGTGPKIEEVVKDVMVREQGDVLRAAVDAVCAEFMEGEVSAQIGADTAPATGGSVADRAGRVSGVRVVRARYQAVTPWRVSTAKPSGNASALACRAA